MLIKYLREKPGVESLSITYRSELFEVNFLLKDLKDQPIA